MKSILMSIQPYYAYLEMKGIKTVEMRKTEPKDKEWSGKVKVYVSQNKKSFNRIPKEDREWFTQYVGKVAYEFVCDTVESIPVDSEAFAAISKPACLTIDELLEYCPGSDMYGWHITALKIYDKPRELGDFREQIARKKSYYASPYDVSSYRTISRYEPITRPPQSWQYVGEVEEFKPRL